MSLDSYRLGLCFGQENESDDASWTDPICNKFFVCSRWLSAIPSTNCSTFVTALPEDPFAMVFMARNPFRVSRTNFQSQTIATPMEWLLDLLICSWRPSENDYGIGRQTVCSCVATNASFLLFSMSTMSFWLDKVSYRTQTLEISACSAGSTMLNFNPSAVAFKKSRVLRKPAFSDSTTMTVPKKMFRSKRD